MRYFTITTILICYFFIGVIYADENSIFLSEFQDTLFFNEEATYVANYNQNDSTSVNSWDWCLIFPGFEYIVASDENVNGLYNFDFKITIDSLHSYLGYLYCIGDSNIMTYKPHLIIHAISSDSQDYYLIKKITILGDTIPYVYNSEDDIYISSGPSNLYENSDITYISIFEDIDGSGSYIDYWTWKLFLCHSGGDYSLILEDSVYGHNTCNWTSRIDTLPTGFDWLKNEDNTVKGYVFVMAQSENDEQIFSEFKTISMNIQSTGIKYCKEFERIPTTCILFQNYPNPFNPTTKITYYLEERSNVELNIYDVLGRKVKTIVNVIEQSAGLKTIVWNGRNDNGKVLPSGIYYYKIVAGDFSEIKRMLYLK